MKNEIGKNLKDSLLYICLFILFRTVFVLIIPLYIKDPSVMKGPIDARVADCKFFDATYVQQAKYGGYIFKEYFEVYLPLDLVFPILYTLMFLTILAIYKNEKFYIYKNRKLYNSLRYLVFAGMIFDYLENFSFSLYLGSSAEISSLVAFFTTIKTFLFILCLSGFIIGFVWASVIYFKNKKYLTA